MSVRHQGPSVLQLHRALSAERLEKHIKVGKHTEGKLAPFAAGVAADRGSGHDRDAKVVHRALTAGASSSSSRLIESNQALKVLADGFVLTYSDGLEYEQKVPEHGWARAQRLPTERSTPAQLELTTSRSTWPAYLRQGRGNAGLRTRRG